MDGFTISNANRFLDTGRYPGVGDSKTSDLEVGSSSVSGSSSSSATDTQASFSDALTNAIGKVNDLQKESDKAAQNLAAGRTDNIADVMIAADKADIALRLMVQVRNKIIDTYQEVMKMQV